MNKKQTFSAILAGIAISAILVTSSLITGSQFSHQAQAQQGGTTTSPGATTTTTTPRSTTTAAPAGEPAVGKTITWQGTVSSTQDPLLGHEKHTIAMILPPRPDGAIYTGVLTFSASKKVEVVVLHNFDIPNSTQVPAAFGSLAVSPFGKGQVAVSVIAPSFGSSPTFSASVPFAGNAVALHDTSGHQFVAQYTVTASIAKATPKDNIASAKSAALVPAGTSTGGTATKSTSGGSSSSTVGISSPSGKSVRSGSSGGSGGSGGSTLTRTTP
jgi:uncharacterized membrane protein YgcG